MGPQPQSILDRGDYRVESVIAQVGAVAKPQVDESVALGIEFVRPLSLVEVERKRMGLPRIVGDATRQYLLSSSVNTGRAGKRIVEVLWAGGIHLVTYHLPPRACLSRHQRSQLAQKFVGRRIKR